MEVTWCDCLWRIWGVEKRVGSLLVWMVAPSTSVSRGWLGRNRRGERARHGHVILISFVKCGAFEATLETYQILYEDRIARQVKSVASATTHVERLRLEGHSHRCLSLLEPLRLPGGAYLLSLMPLCRSLVLCFFWGRVGSRE